MHLRSSNAVFHSPFFRRASVRRIEDESVGQSESPIHWLDAALVFIIQADYGLDGSWGNVIVGGQL